ncbi:SAM-dependent methyltransferase [Streptomyces daliensis]
MNPEDNGPANDWATWREATERALYGDDACPGFFTREAPGDHFRTSVHASPLFAGAVARLLLRVDESLGRPAELALVDVGAGRGELLTGVLGALPDEAARRVRAYAVERAPRPEGLDPRVTWVRSPDTLSGLTDLTGLAVPDGLTGLLFANEWLDNIPVDVAENDENGVPRQVLVRADGTERLATGPLPRADAEWLARWWPLAGGEPGLRAEIGRPRDEAWASAVRVLRRGLAVAVDYAHERSARPPFGTLTGYAEGREVAPVPDGTCDLTSHVALDACAFAADGAVLVSQGEMLRKLGVEGRRPPLSLASTDPAAYVRALSTATQAADLTSPSSLGAFTWLLHPRGAPSRGAEGNGGASFVGGVARDGSPSRGAEGNGG